MRPLFTTSFLIDDFLADNDFFGAETVLITSASSETAIRLAHCLSGECGAAGDCWAPSKADAAFVAGLSTYDDVVTYDAVGGLVANGRCGSWMAGGEATLRAVHVALGDELEMLVPGRDHAAAGHEGR